MDKIKEASKDIKNGKNFTFVMKKYSLTKEELIKANNSIEGFEKISKVIISDGKIHPKGEVLAW